ncbi:hypothetical protein ACLMJK_004884 [Lecanora helva]
MLAFQFCLVILVFVKCIKSQADFAAQAIGSAEVSHGGNAEGAFGLAITLGGAASTEVLQTSPSSSDLTSTRLSTVVGSFQPITATALRPFKAGAVSTCSKPAPTLGTLLSSQFLASSLGKSLATTGRPWIGTNELSGFTLTRGTGTAGHPWTGATGILAAETGPANGSWTFSKKGMTLAPTSVKHQECTETQVSVKTTTVTKYATSQANSGLKKSQATKHDQFGDTESSVQVAGAKVTATSISPTGAAKSATSLPFTGAAHSLSFSFLWSLFIIILCKALLNMYSL